MTSRRWLLIGLACGAGFSLVAVSFAAFSLFVTSDRTTWVVMNQLKGVFGFGLCGLGGFLCGRRGCSLWDAGMSGLIAGSMAAVIYPLSIYMLAYGCINWVRQYPFEYHSMLQSGMTDARDYLVSKRGRATTFETTVGLIPIVLVWAGAQGGLLGVLGGIVARWAGKKFGPRDKGQAFVDDPHAPANRGGS